MADPIHMTVKTRKYIGLTALLVGAVGFFVSMSYFQLFNTTLMYTDPVYITKVLIAFGFLCGGLYLGLLFIAGRGLALVLGGGMALIMLGELALGQYGFHLNLLAAAVALYIGWLTYGGLKSGTLHYRTGNVTRKDNPTKYWIAIAFCVGLALFFVLATLA